MIIVLRGRIVAAFEWVILEGVLKPIYIVMCYITVRHSHERCLHL